MSILEPGGIDCDIHPAVPNIRALHPYLSDHWRDVVVQRGVHELESIAYPTNSPLTSRPDWRLPNGKPGSDLDALRAHALTPFGTSIAICNCLYGVQLLFSEDMGAGFARAVNDWIAAEWLDKEPRLRASIVVPMQNAELAVEEINRVAPGPPLRADPAAGDARPPAGQASLLADLRGGREARPAGRHPRRLRLSPPGHAARLAHLLHRGLRRAGAAFQAALSSLVCEGVFTKFPDLKVVLLESGFTWLPAHLWRLTKFWRGLRMEVPWVDRAPTDIVRSNVRLTTQPCDAPPSPEMFQRLMEHMGSDEMLLFSTDYPHWQFDGDAVLPEGLSRDLVRKIMIDNPRDTYSRLSVPAGLGA